MNNDLLCITLSCINQEQLEVLQAAVRLAGLNFEILYQKGILSEDYVASYGDFFKELGNELTRADDLFCKPARDDSGLALSLNFELCKYHRMTNFSNNRIVIIALKM